MYYNYIVYRNNTFLLRKCINYINGITVKGVGKNTLEIIFPETIFINNALRKYIPENYTV